MFELFYFYYIGHCISSLLNLKWVNKIFDYLNIFQVYKNILLFLFNVLSLLGDNLERFTKMGVIVYLRSQLTWLGQTMTSILEILIPEKKNFIDKLFSIQKLSGTAFIGGPRIVYYIPVEKFISLKYFKYFGYLICYNTFEPTFELFWKSYIYNLSYYNFFKSITEIKYKPSIFLYTQLKQLSNLYDVYNQPINRLMNWLYFETKYKENYNKFNESEKEIVKNNLTYFKQVDDLRAKLMFFSIWDIENFYHENDKDYYWNYWIFQFHSILETTIFQIDNQKSLPMNLKNTNSKLKFYDPDENMEYFNRLFNVLGIINLLPYIDYQNSERTEPDDVSYYVSKKFVNDNAKYDELLPIMYSYDFNRWEESLCKCNYLSNYEVDIVYKTEDYFQNLRAEWETSIKTEKLEERNWRLLKSVEDLM
jgi:hypothetical protein